VLLLLFFFFFFSSRRRHTRCLSDWSSDVCSSDLIRFYAWTLRAVLGFPYLTLLVFIATIALTVTLYAKVPKSYFPQDDSGLIVRSEERRVGKECRSRWAREE